MTLIKLIGLSNLLRFLVLGMSVSVSGCNTLSHLVSEQNTSTDSQSATVLTEPHSTDPWQNKAQALKAQPNRYLSQSAANEIPAQVRTRYAQGELLLSQAKLAEAHTLYLSLAEQYPRWSGIWLQLANIQGSQIEIAADEQDQQQALERQIAYLNNALKANPDNYVAHNKLAVLLRKQGEFTVALRHYDLALSSWPAFPEARLNRGILNDLYLGNKAAALEDYQLYQALLTEPSRQLKGWIIDIERQLQTQQQQYNATSGSIKGDIQ
jgi:tetratricopeptide (TPR) repeat protein